MKIKANFYWYLWWEQRPCENFWTECHWPLKIFAFFKYLSLQIFALVSPNSPTRKTFWKNALKFFIFSLFIPHLSLFHFSPQLFFYVSCWHSLVPSMHKMPHHYSLYHIDRLITVLTYEIFTWKMKNSIVRAQ